MGRMCSLTTRYLVVPSLFQIIFCLTAEAAAPQFMPAEEGRLRSNNGVVTLAWSGDPTSQFVLQQSSTEDFATAVVRYSGPDTESVLTGLSEGVHFFRVGEGREGSWSTPVEVEVSYVGRGTLLLLLGLGFLVVVLTVVAILRGHQREREVRG